MLDVITENIDVWTSAQSPKKSGGRGRSKNGEKSTHGIKKLRELILGLAVTGKLVPQNPNDEPASVLLEKIVKEKELLVKEGKINKQKPFTEICEDEKFYELPKGWEWVRFGNVFELEYGDNLPKEKRSNTKEYPVYGSNGIVGTHNISCIDKPCIVVGRKGSAGALNLCLSEGCWVTDVAYSVVPPSNMNLEFTFKQFHTLGLDSLGKGIKPGLNRNEVYSIPIAIPPEAEQHRIVAKVDELMALCDQLEQEQIGSNAAHQTLVETLLGTLTESADNEELQENWSRINNHFDTLITTEHSIDQLKQTILQLAVMGKLVPQDPNDEPASVLLKKIAKEKERLVHEGKIKKQELLPPIKPEVVPYQLPQGWVWARLPEITFFQEGPGIMAKDFRDAGVPLIRIAGMHNDLVSLEGCNFLDEDMVKKKWAHFKLDSGDIVLSSSASLGKVAKVGDETVGCIVYTGLIRFQPYACLYDDYLIKFFSSNEFLLQIDKSKTGAVIMHFGPTHLKKMVVPLAPISEQHRIVAKVDELMTLCDNLKAQINAAQTTQIQLADAIVEQTVDINEDNEKKYESFLEDFKSQGGICLRGKYWDKAFTIVTGSKKRDNSILPNPLVLSGWDYSDDEEKSERFIQHLNFAYENGKWGKLLEYFNTVPEEAWHKR